MLLAEIDVTDSARFLGIQLFASALVNYSIRAFIKNTFPDLNPILLRYKKHSRDQQQKFKKCKNIKNFNLRALLI